ncbi:MAG: hypothetical protein PVG46_07265 [Desulfobacterales bacterium]|jgi:hypothetical protein
MVPIRGFIKGTDKFPIQKCAIFRKFKEIKELRGGVLLYAAQAIPPIDADLSRSRRGVAEKGHLWTETNWLHTASFIKLSEIETMSKSSFIVFEIKNQALESYEPVLKIIIVKLLTARIATSTSTSIFNHWI